jgi:endonuclease YncB( thermonuclease family)
MIDSRRLFSIFLLATVVVVPSAVMAGDFGGHIDGPVKARIVRVVDGDTILVDATPWPQQSVRVYVRLRGIDAPELHAHCPAIRRAAQMAKSVLARLVSGDDFVRLRAVSGDKYFGRVLADVETPEGADLSATMLSRNLAAPYSGGRRPKRPCPAAG